MGNPVSAISANIYIEIFEKQAIEFAPCKPKIWMPYFDDTFILDRENVLTASCISTVNSHPLVFP